MFLLPKNSKQNQVDNYLLANLHVRGMLWISFKFKFFLDFLQKGGSYKNKVFQKEGFNDKIFWSRIKIFTAVIH